MQIKTTKDKNKYLSVKGGYWVRNFDSNLRSLDINKLYSPNDQRIVIKNENENKIWTIPQIDTETLFFKNLAIISDGYDYKSCIPLIKQLALRKIPCIGVHSVLTKWETGIKYNYYLVNNPTNECLGYLSKSYNPNCIASVRTNPEFIRKYRAKGSVMYWYTPAPTKQFNSCLYNPKFYIDDYRNAICASINLACKWQVEKLLLISPHDLYKEERPGSVKLQNGLYIYPQQQMAHNFIDASLHWLECEVGVISNGPRFENAQNLLVEEGLNWIG